ncbi:MAG: response regulator transcription factor [Solirubrobacteraceae bacterium]
MSTTEPTQNSILDQPRARTTAPAASVLVVDVGVWLRSRLCRLLETEPGFRLAGLADSTDEAMWIAEHEPVDLALIGHHPHSPSGLSLCRQLKRSASPPGVVICSAHPDASLSACCVVAEADALASVYDCDAELAGVLDRVARGIRFLPPVPQRVAAMLHTRLEPAEHAMFSMLLAGRSASDVARGLRMSRTEFESRRWALLGKLETSPPTSGKHD